MRTLLFGTLCALAAGCCCGPPCYGPYGCCPRGPCYGCCPSPQGCRACGPCRFYGGPAPFPPVMSSNCAPCTIASEAAQCPQCPGCDRCRSGPPVKVRICQPNGSPLILPASFGGMAGKPCPEAEVWFCPERGEFCGLLIDPSKPPPYPDPPPKKLTP